MKPGATSEYKRGYQAGYAASRRPKRPAKAASALCLHQDAEPYADKPQFAHCPDCDAGVMTRDLPQCRARWLEQLRHQQEGL